MTGEGWSVMMYIMWDHFPKFYIVLYYSILVLICIFFTANLFIAVLSDSYVKITERE